MSWLGKLYALNVLIMIALSALKPTASYRALDLGLSPSALGLIAASFAILPLLAAVPTGRWIDRHEEKPVFVAGGCLTVVGSVLLALSAGIVALLLSCAVFGLGHVLIAMAAQSSIANGGSPASYDSDYGRFTLATSIGQSIGPLLIPLWSEGDSIATEQIFWTTTGLTLVTLMFAVSIHPPKRKSGTLGIDGEREAAPRLTARQVMQVPGIGPATRVSVAVLCSVDLTIIYLPALGEQRGIAPGTVGIILTVLATGMMLSRFLLAATVARFGRANVMVWSMVLAAAALLVAAIPSIPLLMLAGALAVAGLALGVGQPISMSVVAHAAPAYLRGQATAVRLSANRLGQISVPLAVGPFSRITGPSGIFVATAALLSITALTSRDKV